MLTLVFLSYDAIYSVYTYTPTKEGGLGLSVDIIGLILSFAQLVYICLVPLLLPRLIARCGTSTALNVVLLVWPILAISFPTARWLAETARGPMWMVIGLQQVLRDIGAFSWP